MKSSTLCIVALLGLALAGQAGAQTSADSYRKAGAAYFKAGQFRESVKAYQQVIRLKPNDADAYQQLGEAFTRLNMNKEAAESFEKSADLLTSGNGASASSPTPAATVRASTAAASQSTADKTMPLEEIARRLIRKAYEGRVRNPARVTFTSVQVSPQGTDNYVVNAKYTLRFYYPDQTNAVDYDYHFLLSKQAGTWRLREGDGTRTEEPGSGAKATPPPPGETDVPAAGAAQPERSGNAASASSPTPAVTQSTQNTTPQAQPQPSAAIAQLKYKVGQRVEYVDNGKWHKAIITAVRDDSANQLNGKIYAPYRVHPLGYNGYTDTWVCCADFTDHRSQLRPAGSGPTEPVPGGAAGEANDVVLKAMRGGVQAASAATATATTPTQPGSGGGVPAKQYHCVFFVGDHLEDTAGFTITANSTYTDSEGKRGTYSFNSASATLTFHGGNYDGQRAEYETSGGRPRLHILGKSGRRVIDCD